MKHDMFQILHWTYLKFSVCNRMQHETTKWMDFPSSSRERAKHEGSEAGLPMEVEKGVKGNKGKSNEINKT